MSSNKVEALKATLPVNFTNIVHDMCTVQRTLGDMKTLLQF